LPRSLSWKAACNESSVAPKLSWRALWRSLSKLFKNP
jgi:hypothetical protein